MEGKTCNIGKFLEFIVRIHLPVCYFCVVCRKVAPHSSFINMQITLIHRHMTHNSSIESIDLLCACLLYRIVVIGFIAPMHMHDKTLILYGLWQMKLCQMIILYWGTFRNNFTNTFCRAIYIYIDIYTDDKKISKIKARIKFCVAKRMWMI